MSEGFIYDLQELIKSTLEDGSANHVDKAVAEYIEICMDGAQSLVRSLKEQAIRTEN